MKFLVYSRVYLRVRFGRMSEGAGNVYEYSSRLAGRGDFIFMTDEYWYLDGME